MIRGLWDRDMVAWIIVAGLVPIAVAAVAEFGPDFVWRFGVALAVILIWQAIFLLLRAQPISAMAITTAFAVALLAPGTTEIWHLVLAVSFGSVIGEQVFGGWGRNFIHAAVATLAFLFFGFPETVHAGASQLVAVSTIPAALLLVVFGIVSWQVLLAAMLALLAVTLLLGQAPSELILHGSLAFGLLILVCDPVAAASTRQGRWIYGALAGGLAALFGWTDSGIGSPQAIVFAALLASVFAPLIDATVIALVSRRWRRHNG